MGSAVNEQSWQESRVLEVTAAKANEDPDAAADDNDDEEGDGGNGLHLK